MNAPMPHPLLRRAAPAQSDPAQVDPALQTAVETFATQLRSGLRKISLVAEIAAEPAEAAATIASALQPWKGRAVAALFSLPDATGRIALLVDHALVFAATEAILGGDGGEPPCLPERPLTRIEMRIARILAEQANLALEASLKERRAFALRFEKLETNLDFVDLGLQKSCLALPVRITIFDRTGSLSLIAPTSMAALFAQPVQDTGAAEPAAGDAAWSERLSAEIAQADIRIEARFEDHGLTLGDVAALRIGQQLDLGGGAAELIVESNEHILFRGRLGQADGRYAVRIEDAAGSLSRSRSSL